jgi:hypothetical protein
MAIHTHPGTAPHDHEGDVAGHTHDDTTTTAAPVAAPAAAPAAVTPGPAVTAGPPAGGTAARMVLTILGAAALIIGAFLPWAFGDRGTVVEWDVFYNPQGVSAQAGLITSAGAVFILLGLLALVGLAFETGWLTRLAGALALVGWVLVVITLFRLEGLGAPESGFAVMEIGLWVILLGSILTLIGGFLGSRRVVTTAAY